MDSARPSLHRWEDIPREELVNQIGRRIVTGDKAMLAHVYLRARQCRPDA